jgi:hypothetical protein
MIHPFPLVLTLLQKSGEREDIRNWRPLTLLNSDYKIIAKILAERLKVVLPKLIHSDQKGFVKGRNISEANRLIQDVIEYTDREDDDGIIIFLDQQKAFDRVEWGWNMQSLVSIYSPSFPPGNLIPCISLSPLIAQATGSACSM